MYSNEKKYSTLTLALLSMVASNAIVFSSDAASAKADSVKSPTHYFSSLPHFLNLKQGHAEIQLGGYWINQGAAQHVNIEDLIGDDFTVNSHNRGNGLVGLAYFLHGQDQPSMKMAYGINFFYLPKTSVSGTVIQEGLYTNLSYGYNVTHYPVFAVAKSTIDLNASPYAVTIDAGIGPNFMNTSGFQEQSLDNGITIPDSIFSGRTTTTFSATAGLGIKFKHVFGERPLECGYRFFYLGQGHFNALTNQVVNTLNTGTVYANALMCSMTI
jgi:hypothetical protein